MSKLPKIHSKQLKLLVKQFSLILFVAFISACGGEGSDVNLDTGKLDGIWKGTRTVSASDGESCTFDIEIILVNMSGSVAIILTDDSSSVGCKSATGTVELVERSGTFYLEQKTGTADTSNYGVCTACGLSMPLQAVSSSELNTDYSFSFDGYTTRIRDSLTKQASFSDNKTEFEGSWKTEAGCVVYDEEYFSTWEEEYTNSNFTFVMKLYNNRQCTGEAELIKTMGGGFVFGSTFTDTSGLDAQKIDYLILTSSALGLIDGIDPDNVGFTSPYTFKDIFYINGDMAYYGNHESTDGDGRPLELDLEFSYIKQ